MGSAACRALARRGVSVVGVEQFRVGHDRGSSHGETRIIRLAYFEHPDYVPLLRSSYEGWRSLEKEMDQSVLHETGLLFAGPAGSSVLAGIRESASRHDLRFDAMDGREASRRFSAFRFPDEYEAVYEAEAGYLEPERCVRLMAESARRNGATILEETSVQELRPDVGSFVVRTSAGTLRAPRVVVTVGAWAPERLAEWSPGVPGDEGEVASPGAEDRGEGAFPIRAVRKSLAWHEAPTGHRGEDGFPCFFIDDGAGWFYGFPAVDAKGVKVGNHAGGEVVGSPDSAEREVPESERAEIGSFLGRFLPRVAPVSNREAVCFYTMSPDEHFLIDRHPDLPGVVVAAGFSGHGFKFAPLVGDVLADLALDGRTRHPVGFLKWGR